MRQLFAIKLNLCYTESRENLMDRNTKIERLLTRLERAEKGSILESMLERAIIYLSLK